MDEYIANMSDKDITENMRQNNYEKFKTLVRMHLSFELDLNTDEFDLPCHEVLYYEKGKLKKWSRFSKKIKSCGRSNSSPPASNNLVLDDSLINHLKELKSFILLENNVIQEGIFRKTGSISRQNDLRNLIHTDKTLDLSVGYTVHDCATVYKSLLSDLSEPLLTDAHYPAHCQIAPLCEGVDITSTSTTDKTKELHLLNSMQLLLLLLPDENRKLLHDIIEMLHVVSNYKSENKMPSENLATLFAPHLICPRNLPPEALHYVAQTMCGIVTYMITKGLVIFDIPSKLATDIRAFFLERKRKKTMSPEQTLDESISDVSTVNTVYTFVDREKTAAAHNANNTDTELAQLYAHIQSLPQSSKKRRLIKQFNKQNGQGTPLQLVTMNRIKSTEASRSAKSISESIKRHIFHKGGRIAKSPAVQLNPQGTPNCSTKNARLRVLFQSPLSHNTSGISSSSSTIKTNPLKKSISSTSLLLTHTSGMEKENVPYSAPVSRTTSNDLESGCISTEQKLTCYTTATQKKCVAWNDPPIDQATDENKPSTPLNQSRYRSEPNLSRILKDRIEGSVGKSKSVKRKLIKGVSMGNLRFPFTWDANKKQGESSLSLIHHESSEESETFQEEVEMDTEGENSDSDEKYLPNRISEIISTSGAQSLPCFRNVDLITSTPSLLLGRRSMSPITKSTQRMPKSMQESIMTPRSRKPVILTTAQGSTEQNQIFYQNSFREQDEQEEPAQNNEIQIDAPSGTLSNNFKEYLLTRSLLTASPEDASFYSQPDDFGSTQCIEDLEESEMNPSLLYCLDGNKPTELDLSRDSVIENSIQSETSSFNRKRSETIEVVEQKENVENFLLTKKLFISEYDRHPGETSF